MNNDLFYTCSLIEYIARNTKNKKIDIITSLGKENIKKIYELSSIYHCEDINKIKDEYIKKCNIKMGNYDILNGKEKKPTYFDIGKVYTRLIEMVCNDNKIIDTLYAVMSSWIIEKIDDYDSSLYYESDSYIYECYKSGRII